jgi:DNA polymerase III subunit beta
MADEQLLTISTFARAVGVPASALRYYSAQGVLSPADVDPVTGYRYYAPSQISIGVLVRRMRAADVPLPVMREALTGTAYEAASLLADLLSEHGASSRDRELALRGLLAELAPDDGTRGAARTALPGAVLASAIRQVLAATAQAAGDVSGLVVSMGPRGVTLIASDRYWLAHRHLAAPVEGEEIRAILSVATATDLAETSERAGDVRVELREDALSLHDAHGSVLARSGTVERDVPDLGLLVSTQPSARVVTGFRRADLVELLARPSLGEKVQLVITPEGAQVAAAPPLLGWASGSESVSVLLQAALLAAAVAICPGEEVLISVTDESTPVRVTAPVQDTLTTLVMPMRA